MNQFFTRRQWLQTSLPAAAILSAGWRSLAAEPAKTQEVVARVANLYVRQIWSDGRHNGFPGIARFGDDYYVTFRSATSHQAEEAKIVVIHAKVDALDKWEQVAEFSRDHDSRDPLLVTVGDKLQLVFHSKEDWASQTRDGREWSEPKLLDTEFPEPKPDSGLVFSSKRRWLFRIRRGPDGAYYSLGRCGIKEKGSPGTFGLILYRSEDAFTWKALHTYGEGPSRAIGQGGGSGWGHEADVAWWPDGTMVAAMRTATQGVIATSPPPYREWTGYGTNCFNFGGPALHTTSQGGILLSARQLPETRPPGTFPARGMIWSVTKTGLVDPFYVPSAGDCAYQSFVDGPKGEILLCYYSSHEWPQPSGTGNNPANIYLAHLTVRHGAA